MSARVIRTLVLVAAMSGIGSGLAWCKPTQAGIDKALQNKAGSHAETPVATTRAADSDWFGDEMLRGSYWIHPPVNELGGRFFLFCDQNIVLRKMERARLGLYLRQLKWLGVTDIIYSDLSAAIHHVSDIPKDTLGGVAVDRGRDLLMEVVELAADAGINVWAQWHPGDMPDSMAARDAGGAKYPAAYGSTLDVLSPQYRQLCHALLAEYEAKYNKRQNFKGIYYDELFFGASDFHGDDLARFEGFCRDRFGEPLVPGIGKKLAMGTQWVDPADKWWRRYILFKNRVNAAFIKDLTDACHRGGLQIVVELRPTAVFPTGWSWGMDNEAFTRLGADYYYVASGDYCEPCFAYPNALVGGHVGNTWGYYHALALRGHKGSVHFCDNQFWRLIVYGNNPKGGRQLEQLIRNTREWADGENLASAAILYNQNGLQMVLGKNAPKAVQGECALLDRISRRQDADMILAGAVELYKNYRVLLAPPCGLRGMPPERYQLLRDYVAAGGTLIVMSDCTVARDDLTEEVDRTEDLTGVRSTGVRQKIDGITLSETETRIGLSEQTEAKVVKVTGPGVDVMAVCGRLATPAATRMRFGAGQVIALQMDVMPEIMRNSSAMADWLCTLVGQVSKPAITVSGELKAMTSIKKGNWVAVSLLSEQTTGRGKVAFDMAGLKVTNQTFRVIMLGKGMEIARPGDWLGDQGGWTAAELEQGVGVTIVQDNDEKETLPAQWDLSGFKTNDARYIDICTRTNWDTAGAKKRHYEYEIVVIAPADEIAAGRP